MNCPKCGKTLAGLQCSVCKFKIDTDELVIIGNKGRALSKTIAGFISNQRKQAEDLKRAEKEAARQREIDSRKAFDVEAARRADEAIVAIGSVSFSNECAAKIKHARGTYNALTLSQKAYVKEIKTLQNAEAKFESLRLDYEKEAAAEAQRRKEAAEAAKQREEAERERKRIEEEKRQRAEAEKRAEDERRRRRELLEIQKVESLIDAIGTVSYTTECLDRINSANNSYKVLSDGQKRRVNNYSTLTEPAKFCTEVQEWEIR